MATSRACAPSCRSRSIRRISAAPVSRASLRVCDRWRTRRASSAWPDGARMARGQQAVNAQQPRRRRHPRGHHRAAEDGQDRLGIPGEGGRRDRARKHRDQERHPAHHDQRRGGGGQDPPDQGVHRHPEQVAPGRRVAEQPPQARGVVQRGRVRGRRLIRLGDRYAAPLAGQLPGQAGQPAQGQQHRGHEEAADGEPGGQKQQDQQLPLLAVPRAHRDARDRERGQEHPSHQHQHQHGLGRYQPGKAQAIVGGGQGRPEAEPGPAARGPAVSDRHGAPPSPGPVCPAAPRPGSDAGTRTPGVPRSTRQTPFSRMWCPGGV